MTTPFEQLHGKPVYANQADQTLDVLLDVQRDVISRYRNDKSLSFARPDWSAGVAEKIHGYVGHKLRDVPFADDHLRRLVFASVDFEYRDLASLTWGIYTGALLQLLNQQKIKRGVSPEFIFDGSNGTYHNLFAYAPLTGTLWLQNMRGDSIGRSIAYTRDATATAILCEDIEGDDLCKEAGTHGRMPFIFGNRIVGSGAFQGVRAGIVIGANINGDLALTSISRADLVLGKNINGESALESVANTATIIAYSIQGVNALQDIGAKDSSSIHLVIAKNIRGNRVLRDAGKGDCCVDVIYADTIEGNGVLRGAVSHYGRTKCIIVGNITGDDLLRKAGIFSKRAPSPPGVPEFPEPMMNTSGILERVYLFNNTGQRHMEGANIESCVHVRDEQHYRGILNAYRIPTITRLVEPESFASRTADWKSVQETCQQIREIAASVGTQSGQRRMKRYRRVFRPVPLDGTARV